MREVRSGLGSGGSCGGSDSGRGARRRRKEGEKDASGSDDGEKLHLELEGRVWRDDWGEAPRAVSLSTESS